MAAGSFVLYMFMLQYYLLLVFVCSRHLNILQGQQSGNAAKGKLVSFTYPLLTHQLL